MAPASQPGPLILGRLYLVDPRPVRPDSELVPAGNRTDILPLPQSPQHAPLRQLESGPIDANVDRPRLAHIEHRHVLLVRAHAVGCPDNAVAALGKRAAMRTVLIVLQHLIIANQR